MVLFLEDNSLHKCCVRVGNLIRTRKFYSKIYKDFCEKEHVCAVKPVLHPQQFLFCYIPHRAATLQIRYSENKNVIITRICSAVVKGTQFSGHKRIR